MGKILKYIAISICVACWISSCNSSGCLENKSSIPLAGIYSYTTKKAITIDSITVYGIGAPKDSTILKNAKGVKQIYLPFRINQTSTQYVIHYDQKAISDIRYNDTLTFTYKEIPYFVSTDCGAMYQYDVTEFKYTEHLIDSAALKFNKITNANIESIELYMFTTENTTK